MRNVHKAVFPVGGLGTRFLPATKASPKEMLPVVDKPLIQYAVEEAIAAGMTELIFVTGRGKRAIEDHFDKSYEIEAELIARGKQDLLDLVRGIKPSHVDCIYVRQSEPRGLGHAVLCAEKLIIDEPFAVILADDLIDGRPPVLSQMIGVFDHYHCSVIGVEEIEAQDTRSYGVIEGKAWDDRIFRMSGVVEKPEPAQAPSNLGVVGRYVLTPGIFDHLRKTRPGAGGDGVVRHGPGQGPVGRGERHPRRQRPGRDARRYLGQLPGHRRGVSAIDPEYGPAALHRHAGRLHHPGHSV